MEMLKFMNDNYFIVHKDIKSIAHVSNKLHILFYTQIGGSLSFILNTLCSITIKKQSYKSKPQILSLNTIFYMGKIRGFSLE
jgi:hypothetical protein